MANISDAYGTFNFDFSKTGKTESEVLEWLKFFADELGKWGYPTTLYTSEIPKEDSLDISNVVISFSAEGRWSFATNLNDLANDREIFKDIDNLDIVVAYEEGESTWHAKDTVRLTVRSGTGSIEQLERRLETEADNPLTCFRLVSEEDTEDEASSWFDYYYSNFMPSMSEYEPKPFPNDLKNSEPVNVFTLAYDMETTLSRAVNDSDERFFDLWKESLSKIGNSILTNGTVLHYTGDESIDDNVECLGGAMLVERLDSAVRQAAQFYTRQALNGTDDCTLHGYRDKFKGCVRLMLTEPFYALMYDLNDDPKMKVPFTFRDLIPTNSDKQAWRSSVYPNIGGIIDDSWEQSLSWLGDVKVKERQQELGDIYRVLFEDLATVLYEEKCYGIAVEHAAVLSAAYPKSKTFTTLFSHVIDNELFNQDKRIQARAVSDLASRIWYVNRGGFNYLNYGSFVQNVMNVLNHRYGDSIKIPNTDTDTLMLGYQYYIMKSLDQMEQSMRDSAYASLKPLVESTLDEYGARTYTDAKEKVLDESMKQIAILLPELANFSVLEKTEDITF